MKHRITGLNRRDLLKAVGASVFVSAPAWTARQRPNVLLLFSDQHHAGAMGCAGHPIVRTPTMDHLAATGVRFSRAYCQDGICVPSRTAMMTGLYPRTTGCLDNPNNPVEPERFVMLQHLFKANGYVTGCFGKRHLPRNAMALGWDTSATTISPKLDPSDENYDDWLRSRGLYEAYLRTVDEAKNADLFCKISLLDADHRDAAYTTAKAVTFLERCKAEDKPFFCWATFHGPHQPYTPPKRWANLYPSAAIPLPGNVAEPIANLPPEMQNWRRNTNRPWNLATAAQDPAIYRRYVAYYYAQVSEVDHCMGVILRQLDQLGLAENTIIIYAADHGDFVAHHGMVEKCALGHNVYEDTLRVPLIVSWPGLIRAGTTCDDLTELLDLYPTLIDLAGLSTPRNLQELAGRSLVPVLRDGRRLDREYVFSENWSQVTVIGKRYKLGTWIDPGPLPKYRRRDNRGRCPDMLFDRHTDPLEVDNRIEQSELAHVRAALQAALGRWSAATSARGRDLLIERELRQSG